MSRARRSGARRRDGRDRADARRSGKPREAAAGAAEEGARRRQGERGADGADRADEAALQEGRPARTRDAAGEERGGEAASAPDLEAGALRLQRRGSVGGDGQRAFGARWRNAARAEGAGFVVVSAAIEAEVGQLPEADRPAFLEAIGLHESGLDRVIRAGYGLLDLVTYFTAGPKEARAWTILAAPRPRRRPALSMATSSAASSPRDDRLRRLRRLQGRGRREGRW